MYPPLREGDEVKIYQKKTRGEEQKEVVPVWQEKKYKVRGIIWDDGHEYYELEPQSVGLKKLFLRHELLKVG